MENAKVYGNPSDCTGWRQFLIERVHEGKDDRAGRKLLPLIVWVGEQTVCDVEGCGAVAWLFHPSSQRAVEIAFADGLQRSRPMLVCSNNGRFIE